MESGPGPLDKDRRWQRDPELNFAATLLFSNSNITPHKIAEVLSRLGRNIQAPSRQAIVGFSRREVGGFKSALEKLKKISEGLPELSTRRKDELVNIVSDLVRIIPEKNMSPWMNNSEKRTLAALLLTNRDMQLGEIVHALNSHFHTSDITLASFHKPLRRWKLTSTDPQSDPRASFAEALAKDCYRNNPSLYASLTPRAKQLYEKARMQTRAMRSTIGVGSQQERRALIHSRKIARLTQILSTGRSVPPLSDAAKEHLSFPLYKNLVDAIRDRRDWDFYQHVSLRFFRQHFGKPNKSRPNFVDALVITFNLEGGTPSSRRLARNLKNIIAQEFIEMQGKLSSQGTAMLHAMLTCKGSNQPVLRAFWREKSYKWKAEAASMNNTQQEKKQRSFEISYHQLRRLLGKT